MTIQNVSNNHMILETTDHITNYNTKFDWTCIILLVVSIIGLIGNLLTLCAFQYAKIKKKFQFHRSWNHITIFIWNLALVDLFSAVNMTLLYIQLIFYPNTINNMMLCVAEITLRDIFVLINAASIASIAIVTFMGVTKNNLWKNFCDKSINVNVLIISLWIAGFVVYIPKLIKISYILQNAEMKKAFDCGTFFFTENLSFTTLCYEIPFHFVVIIIIILSYGITTLYATQINSNINTRRDSISLRDTKTCKVAFLIFTIYILQCIPYMVCRLFFEKSLRVGFFIQFPLPQKISYAVYYTQFFPNIIIYVTRNECYRKAYICWIRAFFCCYFKNNAVIHIRENRVEKSPQKREKRIANV